jgi:hypothetical protein
MIWGFVAVLALLIPILAILLDSQVGQAMADRISGDGGEEADPERLEALEAEVQYLSESVERLREETQFLRSLLEGEAPRDALEGPPDAGDRDRGDGD